MFRLSLSVLSVLCVLVSMAAAQEPPADASEVAQRLEQASSRLDAALARVQRLEAQVNALDTAATSNSSGLSDLSGQVEALREKATAPRAAAPAFKIIPYGMIKVDMSYDDTRTNSTDDAAYVQQENPGFGSDKYFAITVRQTTLGVNITGPDLGSARQKGRVEVDFYAPASAENKPELRLKFGYWELAYTDWTFTVGQAPDIISPLSPATVNRDHLDNSGCVGYRRPMIAVQNRTKLACGTLQTDFALARANGGTLKSSASLDDSGSDAAWPLLQARAGMSIPTGQAKPMAFGVSGHVGQEENDVVSGTTTVSGKGDMFMTYSANVDWYVPLCAKLDIQGEFFAGRNMDDFVGGIGQGVNTTLGKPVDTLGGWLQLSYKPVKAWTVSVGGGVDDPENGDLNGGDRDRNLTTFANALYNITDKLSTGAEVSFMKTNYKAGPDGDNVRVQTALMYRF